MRKLTILTLVACVAAAGAFAQTPDANITEFQDTFKDFSDAFAGTLALNSTIGNTWSDSFIGGFPHLGAGLTIGATSTDPDKTAAIFDMLGQTAPDWADKSGIPIPAFMATAKIGLPFLPMDVGAKIGFIPKSVGDQLGEIKVDYLNLGVNARFRVLEDKLLLPEIAVGAGVNYLAGAASMPVGDAQTISYTDGTHNWDLNFSDPQMLLEWKATTVDLNAQVSKQLLFFLTPYAGAGATFGGSSVNGGLNSTMTMLYDGSPATEADKDALIAALEAAGQDVPDFSSDGFMYAVEALAPTFRVYGGLGLNIFFLHADAQLMYVPATKNFGFSVNARIQF